MSRYSLSPPWKVFSLCGEYMASCRRPEDAAAIAARLGPGASVRHGHARNNTVWLEGSEGQHAAKSYGDAGKVMRKRWNDLSSRRS
jgi:hypothetical protein